MRMTLSKPAQALADRLPDDATPMRKIGAAASYLHAGLDGSEEFLTACIDEARTELDAPRRWIDMALGETEFDMITWQEILATLNEQERSDAVKAMKARMAG